MSSLPSTGMASLLDLLDGRLDGLVDAPLEEHGVGAGGDVLQAFEDDGLSEHGRGRGAVTGDIVGLGRDFLAELGAHVLVGIGQLDLLGDGDAVLGDHGGAVLLLQHDVAALGPSVTLTALATVLTPRSSARRASASKASCFAAIVDASFDRAMTGLAVGQLRLVSSAMARMSLSRRMRYSSPSTLTSVPPYLAKMTLSPTFTSRAHALAVVEELARTDGDHLALLGLLLGGVGEDDAARGLLFLLDDLDDDAVAQRLECHSKFPPCTTCR